LAPSLLGSDFQSAEV